MCKFVGQNLTWFEIESWILEFSFWILNIGSLLKWSCKIFQCPHMILFLQPYSASTKAVQLGKLHLPIEDAAVWWKVSELLLNGLRGGDLFFFFFKYRTSSFIDVFSASAGLKNESIKLSGQMCECKDGESPMAECKLVLMSSVFSKGSVH